MSTGAQQHENKVVVGVDGSAASLHALRWAMEHVKHTDLQLHVVCTYALPSFTAASMDGGFAALDDQAIRAGAQSVLDQAMAVVQDEGLPSTGEVCVGDPAAVLVELSKEAALSIVGTRGHGGFAGRLLGTVSSALPAHGHCPTVVVPRRSKEHEEASAARSGALRIVAGVDGSTSSILALEHAFELAQLYQARLYVIGGVPLSKGSSLLSWLPAAVDRESILQEMQDKLEELAIAKRAGYPDVPVQIQVLDGSGAELLSEFSEASDLIVVGTRGRGGFAGMLLGSTSQSLLHHAQCPVMVVPERIAKED